MRLLSAHMENFRLLRDLDLNFSTDPKRKLTVIRAANETGKTTILNALQWALYGDGGLPNKGADYRLHPIDWDISSGPTVRIAVGVDFEVVKYNRIAGVVKEHTRRYRIIRAAIEELQGTEWQRTSTTVRLFELTPTGSQPIDPPEAIVNDELPQELREVFFTDGDRALSFIESDVAVSTKRDRVQRAIRSLLGLGIIEDAIRHVKKSSADINKQVRQIGGGSDLSTVVTQLDSATDDIAKLEQELAVAKENFVAFDEKLAEVARKLDEALRRGDREQLRRELEAAGKSIQRLDDRLAVAVREHSALFKSEALARDILEPALSKAFALLKQLHDSGRIPNTTIPVLEDRLAALTCICGESLADDSGAGTARRKHIQHLIDSSRHADETQAIVTRLYFGSKGLEGLPVNDDDRWLAKYAAVVKNRDGLTVLREEEGQKLKALEVRLDALPETDVQALREVSRQYSEQRDRFNSQKSKLETQLEAASDRRDQLSFKRDRLLREQKKGARIVSDLEVSQDVLTVLSHAYQQITDDELKKVSDLMNATFLEMIGADPDQGAVIKRAEISPEFDILVFGPDQRRLNPDRDLNGASRRALTLSFILALTKVSEVEAPNVIDTPLGMMSGYVKRSVLQTAIRESSQLVLLLTHSEISGCEELIDQYAGRIFTLTNPTHYPKMLVNMPPTQERKVLRCDCDHRHVCSICERREESNDTVLAAEILS